MSATATAMPRPVQRVNEAKPAKPVTETSQTDIAALAYALWQQRGCPDGSPEVDWLEAEKQAGQ